MDIGGGCMVNTNATIVRGDTWSFGVKISFDDDVQNLDTAYLSCKLNYDDYDYIFRKSLNDGIDLAESDSNSVTYRVRVDPLDTKTLEPGNYLYDLQIGINHDIFTILKGVLKIERDMTH